VPEILPDSLIKLAEPVPEDLIAKTMTAITELPKFEPWRAHDEVREMYSWYDVALRTENVYKQILKADPPTLLDRLRRFVVVGGAWAGKIWALMMAFGILLAMLWEVLWPRSEIDIAPDFPTSRWASSAPLPDQYFGTTGAKAASTSTPLRNSGGRRGSAPAKSFVVSQQNQTLLQQQQQQERLVERAEEEEAEESSSSGSSPNSDVKKILKMAPDTPKTPYGSNKRKNKK
jgi:hypothetical protein